MTELRDSIVLKDARTINLNHQVTSDGYTMVMNVKGPLTPDLADALRCRKQIYDASNNPWPALRSLKLDHEFRNLELSVPGRKRMMPTVATGFAIEPSQLADSDHKLEVHFRMKFENSSYRECNDLVWGQKDNPFDLALISLQGGLFEQQGDGAAGGSRVDMSGGSTEQDRAAAAEFAGIHRTYSSQVGQDESSTDADGEEPVDEDQEPPPILVQEMMKGNTAYVDEVISSGNTLPSAREMAGGTTAAAVSKGRGRPRHASRQ